MQQATKHWGAKWLCVALLMQSLWLAQTSNRGLRQHDLEGRALSATQAPPGGYWVACWTGARGWSAWVVDGSNLFCQMHFNTGCGLPVGQWHVVTVGDNPKGKHLTYITCSAAGTAKLIPARPDDEDSQQQTNSMVCTCHPKVFKCGHCNRQYDCNEQTCSK